MAVKSIPHDFPAIARWHAVHVEVEAIDVHFCDPKLPWQRGSNENTNGLLRQKRPGGLDFQTLTQDDLDAIALESTTVLDRPSASRHHRKH